jgi:hypothetical protein
MKRDCEQPLKLPILEELYRFRQISGQDVSRRRSRRRRSRAFALKKSDHSMIQVA